MKLIRNPYFSEISSKQCERDFCGWRCMWKEFLKILVRKMKFVGEARWWSSLVKIVGEAVGEARWWKAVGEVVSEARRWICCWSSLLKLVGEAWWWSYCWSSSRKTTSSFFLVMLLRFDYEFILKVNNV